MQIKEKEKLLAEIAYALVDAECNTLDDRYPITWYLKPDGSWYEWDEDYEECENPPEDYVKGIDKILFYIDRVKDFYVDELEDPEGKNEVICAIHDYSEKHEYEDKDWFFPEADYIRNHLVYNTFRNALLIHKKPWQEALQLANDNLNWYMREESYIPGARYDLTGEVMDYITNVKDRIAEIEVEKKEEIA